MRLLVKLLLIVLLPLLLLAVAVFALGTVSDPPALDEEPAWRV